MVFYFIYYFCIYLFCFIVTAIGGALLVDFSVRSRGYKGPISDHFDGVEFYTPGHSPYDKLYDHAHGKFFWGWVLKRPKNHWQHRKNKFRTVPEKRVKSDRIFVTFINHSTVLLQTKSLNIITDPVFANKIGPNLPFIRMQRYSSPGIKLKELPKIDLVLLSHNHYDHMDLKTLRYISIRDKARILTPLGNSQYLKSHRVKGGEDMDWWDKKVINEEVSVVCIPSQHFSARAITDRNKTLWGGFVLELPRGNIYFAGDTGYGDFLNIIKKSYEKFILGLVPIGAYKPEWFMAPVHISPEEAVNVHHELNIETSVAIHFGTFKLADDGQDEAKEKIKKMVRNSDMKKLDFRVLENGQTIVI